MANSMEFKSTEVKQVCQDFTTKIQPNILAFYNAISDKHSAFVSTMEKRYAALGRALKKVEDNSEKVELQREFKKELLELLTSQGEILTQTGFDNFYAHFEGIVNQEFGELKRIIHINEPFGGYTISVRENPISTLRKVFVNGKRTAVLSLKRFANYFRKIFRREPLELVVYKKRRVLLRSMTKEFVLNQLLDSTSHLVARIMESQSLGLIQLWELDESIDIEFQKILAPDDYKKNEIIEKTKPPSATFKTVKSEHQALMQEIEKEIQDAGVEVFKQFDDAFQKVDSLDLSNRKFNAKKLEKNKINVIDDYKSELARWKNSHTALIDDWSVDVEITLLYYSAFDEFNFFNERIKTFVEKEILTAFTSIRGNIEKSKKAIDSKTSSKKAAKETISKERARLAKELIDRTITKTVERLAGCFAKDFGELREEMLALVNQVSGRRAFIKNKGYINAVKESEVKYISPRELLYFEALPVYKDRVNEIEIWADAQLEKVRINLLGIGTVCDFTLESALVILEQKSGTPKNAIEASVAGFNRALTHLEKAEAMLQNGVTTLEKDLSEAINDFDDDILKLKDTDNLLELNIKIARIKTVERTKKYNRKAKEFISKTIPKIKEIYFITKTKVSKRIYEFKLRIGITVQKKYVSFELSEFVEHAQRSLKKLPFVYQRLYQLNPTDEERFFVNRNRELDLLSKAFENWKHARFITVAIIGDKGSGTTSLINYFLKKSEIDIDIIMHTLSCKVHTSESYLNLFSILFGVEKFENNDQIIDFINQSEGTRIVILENLQHMFLKKVNGFDCMNMFFELMAHTMKKVLWIGAYTSHSWNFLDRTIHISNYFTNEIYVGSLGQNSIQEIIYKRNRLSGYQIVFQPNEFDVGSKKFLKLNENKRQEFLRNEFFKTLYRISSGNISLAQLYWLQSTKVASDEVIEISPINEFDFSFVKNLSSDELFAMQVLVLHDGLELEDFSKVMGKPISVSRNLLTPMLEKGLLIKPRLKYNINPIIFRPVANYLASRNFIN